MSRRLADVARKVGVSEATVSRVLNEKPGVSRGHAAGRAHRTRRARATSARPSCAASAPGWSACSCPSCRTRSSPRSANWSAGALAQNGYTPGALHADRRRHHRGRLRRAAAAAAGLGGRLRRRRSTPRRTPRTSTTSGCASSTCRPCSSTRRARPRFPDRLDATTRRRSSRRGATSRSSATAEIGLVLGPTDHMPSRRKLAAARRARSAAGLALPDEPRRALALLARGRSGGCRAAARARASPAIICASDPLALGAVRAVRRAGLRVPEDVSVIGFDDSALMNCIDPPLTTVRQPIEPMGRMVIELLVRQMSTGSPRRRRVPVRAGAGRAGVDGARPRRGLTSFASHSPCRLMRRQFTQVACNLLSSCINLFKQLHFYSTPLMPIVALTGAHGITVRIDEE